MISTVLFDLDGTIIDTNELIIRSFLHALEGVTEEPMTREKIVPHMGFALVDQIKFFTGLEQVDELVAKYREFNIGKHDELVTEFPHVRDVLEELKNRGVRMGVVTNKMRVTTMMGLRLCSLEPYMDVVITVDDVTNGKPHPEPVLKAVELLGAAPEATLMVGDSQYDLIAGRDAGTRTAGVSWSLKGEEYLQTFRPDYMLRDMRDLLDIVGTRGM